METFEIIKLNQTNRAGKQDLDAYIVGDTLVHTIGSDHVLKIAKRRNLRMLYVPPACVGWDFEENPGLDWPQYSDIHEFHRAVTVALMRGELT